MLPVCEPVPLSVPSVVLCVCVGWCAAVPAVSLWDGLPVVVCLWLLIGGLWSVTSTPCQPVRVWDGEPVGLVAVVSTLDTLPACEPVPWSLCGWSATVPAVSVWDGEPVGGVACSQYPRHSASL